MAAINTKTFFNAQTLVAKRVFLNNAKKVTPQWQELFNVIPNDPKRGFLTESTIYEMGTYDLRPEYAPPVYDAPGEGLPITVTFVTRALAYRFSREAREEDVFNLIGRIPAMLAYSGIIDEELNFWNVLNQAFNGAVLYQDGQPLCSTAHPLQAMPGVTLSNSGGNLALAPEALQTAWINGYTLMSERGMPSQRFYAHLWVPPQLKQRAEEITGSSHYPYTDENRINIQHGAVKVHVVRWITNPKAWFLTAEKGDVEGDTHSLFVSFKHRHFQNTWKDEATQVFNHSSEYKAAWGAKNWRGIYGSQGS